MRLIAICGLVAFLGGWWLKSRTDRLPLFTDVAAARQAVESVPLSTEPRRWEHLQAVLRPFETRAAARNKLGRGLIGLGLGALFASVVPAFLRGNQGAPLGCLMGIVWMFPAMLALPMAAADDSFRERLWTVMPAEAAADSGPPTAISVSILALFTGVLVTVAGWRRTVSADFRWRGLTRRAWLFRTVPGAGAALLLAGGVMAGRQGEMAAPFLAVAWTGLLAAPFFSGPPVAAAPRDR